MVALITVVFLPAPGAANCGGGRGWGAGADHNCPVPAPAVRGGSPGRVDKAPRYHKALALSQCSVSDSVINWAGLTGRGRRLGYDWWRLHHASLTSGPGHNSSSTLNRAKSTSNRNIRIGKQCTTIRPSYYILILSKVAFINSCVQYWILFDKSEIEKETKKLVCSLFYKTK